MPKQYNIKWRPSDNQRIAARVRAFNGKLTRLINKQPEFQVFLPKRITTQQIREQVKTRADLNNILNSLSRFSRKGAETPITTNSGIQTTAWQIKEASIRVGVINRKRKAKLKQLNPSTEKGTMGSIEENNLRPKRFNPNKTKPEDWDALIESINKQSRPSYEQQTLERYKENYIKGVYYNYSPVTAHLVNELLQIVENLSPQQLFNASFDDPILTVGFLYDPLEQITILQAAIDNWKDYLSL